MCWTINDVSVCLRKKDLRWRLVRFGPLKLGQKALCPPPPKKKCCPVPLCNWVLLFEKLEAAHIMRKFFAFVVIYVSCSFLLLQSYALFNHVFINLKQVDKFFAMYSFMIAKEIFNTQVRSVAQLFVIKFSNGQCKN